MLNFLFFCVHVFNKSNFTNICKHAKQLDVAGAFGWRFQVYLVTLRKSEHWVADGTYSDEITVKHIWSHVLLSFSFVCTIVIINPLQKCMLQSVIINSNYSLISLLSVIHYTWCTNEMLYSSAIVSCNSKIRSKDTP